MTCFRNAVCVRSALMQTRLAPHGASGSKNRLDTCLAEFCRIEARFCRSADGVTRRDYRRRREPSRAIAFRSAARADRGAPAADPARARADRAARAGRGRPAVGRGDARAGGKRITSLRVVPARIRWFPRAKVLQRKFTTETQRTRRTKLKSDPFSDLALSLSSLCLPGEGTFAVAVGVHNNNRRLDSLA